MAFIVKNTSFVCEWCGQENNPAPQTCRNHCKHCLSSKHLDESFPGDRESLCMGKMTVVEVESHAKHEFVFVHQCEKCGKKIKNKKAEDDSVEAIIQVMKRLSDEKMKR